MTAAAQPPSETLIASLRDRHTTWMTVIPTMLAAADAIERLERDLAAAKARVVELEERATEDTAAGRLIDAWCAEKGTKIPWSKAVQIVAIVTKQSDAERDRLLRLGDEDGSCGMCGRSDAERDLAQATIARQAEELERVREDAAILPDVASMCRRLSYALKRTGANDALVMQCVELLKKHGLGGNILRADTAIAKERS